MGGLIVLCEALLLVGRIFPFKHVDGLLFVAAKRQYLVMVEYWAVVEHSGDVVWR